MLFFLTVAVARIWQKVQVLRRWMPHYFLRNFGICIIILILTLNFNFAVLKLLKLLVDGDVESNPLKVVQGSFHQGNPNLVILPEYNVHATPYLQYVGLLLNV